MLIKSTPNQETKFQELDLKSLSEEGYFEGYASIFGEVDQGRDATVKGAFRESLKKRGVKMLWQHDPSQPIGVWDEVKEDDKGLWVKGRLLTSLQRGKEVSDMMKAGIIDGLSIGYRTIKALRDEMTGVRQLKEVELWEISLVTFPMQMSATVTSVKGEWDKRDAERVLRDAGMPNAMATKLIAGGWDAANTSGGQGELDDGANDLSDTVRRMNENLNRRM